MASWIVVEIIGDKRKMTLIINGKTYEAGELVAYVKKLEKENKELRNRNAELKEMYAHSAKEAETYKQFLELKEKEQRELIDKINDLEEKLANADYQLEGRDLEIKELKEQIEKIKQERSVEVRQRAINEIVSAIERDREEGR